MADTVVQQEQSKITPAQRNMFFNQMTRQHKQAAPTMGFVEGQTISMEVPKARLLSNIILKIEGEINITHATSTAMPTVPESIFGLLRKVEVNLNNGFSPYVCSGADILALNLIDANGHIVEPLLGTNTVVAASRRKNKLGITADTALNDGADNRFQMIVELPLTLNRRDPAGLYMLQAPDVLVNVIVTFGNFASHVCGNAAYTVTMTSGTVTPVYETFSIPKQEQARPDLSILKLYHSRTEQITAAGIKTINLPTGYMYRKLIFWLKDANGAGMTDAALNTNFDLLMNTADRPYSVPHRVLAEQNQQDYGVVLPNGLFVFDFTSNAGIPNYGSARDYIDTAQLTEFELQFTAPDVGSIQYAYETLSVLGK